MVFLSVFPSKHFLLEGGNRKIMVTCTHSGPIGQLLTPARAASHVPLSPPLPVPKQRMAAFPDKQRLSSGRHSGGRGRAPVVRSSPGGGGGDGEEDGVSLGTMKLPLNTDLPRFEVLLFQWANSLSQGANLPLPVPLKVDKISGGARLGFIEIGDGKTEVTVYIDCLVFPATEGSGPFFRAIRNGPMKDRTPPGEPRIMRSLQQALEKSVEIARV